jgi:putative transcriptional regulator
MYKPIKVDRQNLTLMGVPFPDLKSLESAASAIGSQMFEGYEPTINSIMLIRDLLLHTITPAQFTQKVKAGQYA